VFVSDRRFSCQLSVHRGDLCSEWKLNYKLLEESLNSIHLEIIINWAEFENCKSIIRYLDIAELNSLHSKISTLL
jgi:hypothetical protein